MYNWIIGRKIIRKAAGHIAITADEISQFQTYGVEREKITIIPNGVNPDDFEDNNVKEFRVKYGLGETPFILFMGRLNPAKGPDLILTAFCNVNEQLASYHLVFAGPDEDMLSCLQRTVSRHQLENRVHFLGYLEGPDKSRAYAAAEFLVIPSRREAMSIVALEAGIVLLRYLLVLVRNLHKCANLFFHLLRLRCFWRPYFEFPNGRASFALLAYMIQYLAGFLYMKVEQKPYKETGPST